MQAQTLGAHPLDGRVGVWFLRTGDPPGGWVGVAKTDLQALPDGTGSAAQRRATWTTNAIAAIQAQVGPGYVVSLDVTASAPFDLNDMTIQDV